MAYKRAFDEIFIEGTIQTVAEIGIENTRTKNVADYAGFSEATMYRRFPSKEILLRETFLYIDKQISSFLTQSSFIRNPEENSFEHGIYGIWHKLYRYLIEHKEETLFLIRYRYSSLYTDEVRKLQQAYNGGFNQVYKTLDNYFGSENQEYRDFLINYIFEITLCFAGRIIEGRAEDDDDTECGVWLAVSNSVKSWTRQQGEQKKDDEQRVAAAQ